MESFSSSLEQQAHVNSGDKGAAALHPVPLEKQHQAAEAQAIPTETRSSTTPVPEQLLVALSKIRRTGKSTDKPPPQQLHHHAHPVPPDTQPCTRLCMPLHLDSLDSTPGGRHDLENLRP